MPRSSITDIYTDVTFGKGHIKRCQSESRQDISKFTDGGKKFINIKLNANYTHPSIPTEFATHYDKYTLVVKDDGEVTITADYYPGLVRALDTLSQIIVKDESEEHIFKIEYAPLTIEDEPTYAYRGVMLDTARDYLFPDTIKQMLDGMMLGRLNVFHWHINDDESFPLKLSSYPGLTEKTAFTPREIYTSEIVKDIVDYARIRAIRVIPEFQAPGHQNALGLTSQFKDIIACAKPHTVSRSSNSRPEHVFFDPTNNQTYTFIQKLFTEFSSMFDHEFWHLGGDDAGKDCWASYNNTMKYMTQNSMDTSKLYQLFVSKERDVLSTVSPSTKAIYWHKDNSMKYKDGDILQLTGDRAKIETTINSFPNNKFILSPDDIARADEGYPTYTGTNSGWSTLSWNSVNNFDPSTVGKSATDRILGVEMIAYSEMSNEFDLPTKVFPKAGVMSFRAWNPAGPHTGGQVYDEYMKYQYRVKAYGVPTEKISMRYCEVHTHHCFGK